MNSRSRVKLAMERRLPDRVPVLPAMCFDHAAFAAGGDLLELVINPLKVYEVMLEAARLYGFDGVRIWFPPDPEQFGRWEPVTTGDQIYLKDARSGEIIARVDVDGAGGLVPVKAPPVADETQVKRLWKSISSAGDYKRSGRSAPVERFIERAQDDFFVVGMISTGVTMNFLMSQRGNPQGLIDLYDNPGLAKEIMDIGVETAIEMGKALVAAGVDGIYMGDAWSSCSVISPGIFREFCLPRYQRVVDALRPLGVKIYLHVCGDVRPILEMMADTGVDAIEPLDPLGGVELEDAKKRVGDRVCLIGGVNTLSLMNRTPEEVFAESISCIERAGRNGGYILGAGDAIPRCARPENVKAMVAAAQSYRYDTDTARSEP